MLSELLAFTFFMWLNYISTTMVASATIQSKGQVSTFNQKSLVWSKTPVAVSRPNEKKEDTSDISDHRDAAMVDSIIILKKLNRKNPTLRKQKIYKMESTIFRHHPEFKHFKSKVVSRNKKLTELLNSMNKRIFIPSLEKLNKNHITVVKIPHRILKRDTSLIQTNCGPLTPYRCQHITIRRCVSICVDGRWTRVCRRANGCAILP